MATTASSELSSQPGCNLQKKKIEPGCNHWQPLMLPADQCPLATASRAASFDQGFKTTVGQRSRSAAGFSERRRLKRRIQKMLHPKCSSPNLEKKAAAQLQPAVETASTASTPSPQPAAEKREHSINFMRRFLQYNCNRHRARSLYSLFWLRS